MLVDRGNETSEAGVEIIVLIGYFIFLILNQKKYSNQSKVK